MKWTQTAMLMGVAAMAIPGQGGAQTTGNTTPPAVPAPSMTQPSTVQPRQPDPAMAPRTTTTPDRAAGVLMEGAPATGANSFTEGQTVSRIDAASFTQVTGLRNDESGVWRGRAMQGGNTVDVALDFRGMIYAGAAARAPATTSRTDSRPGPTGNMTGNTTAPAR